MNHTTHELQPTVYFDDIHHVIVEDYSGIHDLHDGHLHAAAAERAQLFLKDGKKQRALVLYHDIETVSLSDDFSHTSLFRSINAAVAMVVRADLAQDWQEDTRVSYPFRIFDNRDEALSWLQQF